MEENRNEAENLQKEEKAWKEAREDLEKARKWSYQAQWISLIALILSAVAVIIIRIKQLL